MRLSVAGDNSFIIYVGDHPSADLTASIQQATTTLEINFKNYLVDLVPSYASILVIYDQDKINYRCARNKLNHILHSLTDHTQNKNQGLLVELPVYYGEECGPDLQAIADRAELTVDDVIHLHQAQEYRVYAIGFAPGFAYLGEVDERIAAPRLKTPRLKVPRGAVAIADRQTAVYPAESPGGWNLIGLCPALMFNPEIIPAMPVSVGDRVKFKAISRRDFLSLGGEL